MKLRAHPTGLSLLFMMTSRLEASRDLQHRSKICYIILSSLVKCYTFQIISRDSCDYADCDYADYADGPIKYKQFSQIQAENKKNSIAEEKEL